MNNHENRDFRPAFHYTPPFGWTNDPNGLTYEDGTWHLFAQHYPNETHWGPMHWRHAISDDLLHWKDVGIALYPDDQLGWIFSGSAVIDHGNTSGLGRERDPMVLIYTHHGAFEQQSIAWSEDRVNFTPYAGNPVIPNAEKKNFRDPKVFRNPVLGGWTMAVAAGDCVEFYASPDLIHWRVTGSFGKLENRMGGIFECPDLFPLTAPDGETVWVLTASVALPNPFGGSRMVYFLGEFDGETFRETLPSPQPKLIDFGYDNYAAVTFANADRPLMVGWGSVPAYAMDLPTGEFRGLMTFARELSLVQTDVGPRLAAKPVVPAFNLEPVPAEVPPADLSKTQMLFPYLPKAVGTLPGEVFHVRVEAPAGFRLTLSNDDGEALHVTLSSDQRLVVDRTAAGRKGFSALFDSGLYAVTAAPRLVSGPMTLDLYFDRMIAEIFADGGTLANATAVFPEKPYTRATLEGKGRLWIGEAKD